MNSEKVKEIKKALEQAIDMGLVMGKNTMFVNIKLADILSLINELGSENEILKINMHETENLSFQINQMNGNLILENQALKDRIAELEETEMKVKTYLTDKEHLEHLLNENLWLYMTLKE